MSGEGGNRTHDTTIFRRVVCCIPTRLIHGVKPHRHAESGLPLLSIIESLLRPITRSFGRIRLGLGPEGHLQGPNAEWLQPPVGNAYRRATTPFRPSGAQKRVATSSQPRAARPVSPSTSVAPG